MVDGAAVLMTMFHGMRHMGFWDERRGYNMLDTGAHFYDTYACKDGKYISLGSIEPQFYKEMLERLGLAGEQLPHQMDKAKWPELKKKVAAVVATKTRDEWCAIMEGTDVCFAPVLSMTEAIDHPHNKLRGTFTEVAGLSQPAPAPRFSRTKPEIQGPPAQAGEHTDAALRDWGVADARLAELRAGGAIA